MSNDTWAIVIATFMGPIFAVWISLWREARNERQSRRFYIFRTLMATRKIAMSREQVDALNLVETEFQGVPSVQSAYAGYVSHLYQDSNAPNWDEERQDHLARLLHHMSVEIECRSMKRASGAAATLPASGPSGTTSSNICTTWR